MGMNDASRLKAEGLDVSKTDVLTISIHEVYFPPRTGHALSGVWHPRSELTESDEGIARLIAEIVQDGKINKPILVREDWIRDGENKRKVFTCVDGAGRTVAGLAAERIMHEAGRLTRAGKDGEPARVRVPLRVKIELFVGDNLALLKQRQLADSDPSKRAHTPSVLATMACQMFAEGGTVDDVFATMPRFVLGALVSQTDVEGFKRWGLLHADVVRGIDAGTIPFGLFRALLDEPRDEQSAAAVKLVEAGATNVKGATRAKNKAAKVEAWKTPADPAAVLAGVGAPPVLQRPHPKTMRKVADKLGEPAFRAFDTAQAFRLGVLYALGEDVSKEVGGDVLALLMNASGTDVPQGTRKGKKAVAK